jgi:hypothetical protein
MTKEISLTHTLNSLCSGMEEFNAVAQLALDICHVSDTSEFAKREVNAMNGAKTSKFHIVSC